MSRPLKIYLPFVTLIIVMGLPARVVHQHLPNWYVLYFGDFLWAMLIFFLYALVLKLSPLQTLILALVTTYLIEISQLFQPEWLQTLRAIKPFALILGHGFLWSDILAYSLGILLAAQLDHWTMRGRQPKQTFSGP